MRRRDFISVLGGAAAASTLPGGAVAQAVPSIFRIGIVSPAASKSTLLFDTFRTRLKELGYVEDRDIVIEFRLAAGAPEKVPALAADLVRQPVDVLVADGAHVIGVLQGLTQDDPDGRDHWCRPSRCRLCFQPRQVGRKLYGGRDVCHRTPRQTSRAAQGGNPGRCARCRSP
jgi:hypothetical protein